MFPEWKMHPSTCVLMHPQLHCTLSHKPHVFPSYRFCEPSVRLHAHQHGTSFDNWIPRSNQERTLTQRARWAQTDDSFSKMGRVISPAVPPPHIWLTLLDPRRSAAAWGPGVCVCHFGTLLVKGIVCPFLPMLRVRWGSPLESSSRHTLFLTLQIKQ